MVKFGVWSHLCLLPMKASTLFISYLEGHHPVHDRDKEQRLDQQVGHLDDREGITVCKRVVPAVRE